MQPPASAATLIPAVPLSASLALYRRPQASPASAHRSQNPALPRRFRMELRFSSANEQARSRVRDAGRSHACDGTELGPAPATSWPLRLYVLPSSLSSIVLQDPSVHSRTSPHHPQITRTPAALHQSPLLIAFAALRHPPHPNHFTGLIHIPSSFRTPIFPTTVLVSVAEGRELCHCFECPPHNLAARNPMPSIVVSHPRASRFVRSFFTRETHPGQPKPSPPIRPLTSPSPPHPRKRPAISHL
jgi:hypothetical protein